MGYQLNQDGFASLIEALKNQYDIYAPVVFEGAGPYSDTDMIRYAKINNAQEIVFSEKSAFSFKEVITPIMQTLFYFTENQIKEADDTSKESIILLRHCDLKAMSRLDAMYLHNGKEDYYYKRIRNKMKFIVMGCQHSFENCFCVSMNCNYAQDYDASIDCRDDGYYMDCKLEDWNELCQQYAQQELEVQVDYVKENDQKVHIPKNLSAKVMFSKMWDEYDARCIACGRCNFVCPTCTCFTMQDIFYQDNARVGERRRVWASCMVDDYTSMAQGHSCRHKHGERMRFKVMHKVYDHNRRFHEQMCTGCGRCDDICPEYISFSNAINKLEAAMQEVSHHDE